MAVDTPWPLAELGYGFDPSIRVWRPTAQRPDFAYSDGDATEARLLSIVQAAEDRSVLSPTLRASITDWPSLYHFSPLRANLLRPLQAQLAGRRILEIGAGCGALTRFMGESGAQVLALEGSPQRAAIVAARCADLAQVTVVADTLQHLPAALRFDQVTLIGVLEYARLFFPADADTDPVDAMLARAAQYLNPQGLLLVAIENQLGLKYFAGYSEDHLGIPLYGIEDLYASDGVVTFGRAELQARLDRAGLTTQQWLYPFPDYKLPRTLLTERAVQCRDDVDLSPLLSMAVAADPQRPSRVLFALEQAWRVVYRNRLAGELANSFLVVATGGAEPQAISPDVLAYHYSVDRRPQFAKQLRIESHPDGCRVINQALSPHRSHEHLPVSLHWDTVPFQVGELWLLRLVRMVNQPGWDAAMLAAWLQPWLQQLLHDAGLDRRAVTLLTRLDGQFIDAVPQNLLMTETGGCFIDLEWRLRDGIEFGHVLYRAVVLSLLAVSSMAAPAVGQPTRLLAVFKCCAQQLGWTVANVHCQRFHACEKQFQYWATGQSWCDFVDIADALLPIRT